MKTVLCLIVHCQAGISRSASIVIAYLMTKRNMPMFKDALAYAQERRYMVYPNDGFTAQLIDYQAKLAET